MNYMAHPKVECHVQLFFCHLKIVTEKLEKIEGRPVCVMELVLYRAQLTRLESFKKENMRMCKSLELHRGQTVMENKINKGLAVEP